MTFKTFFSKWRPVVADAYYHTIANDLRLMAAGISFYFLVAIFPAIGMGFAFWTLFASKELFVDSANAILSIVPPEGRHILHDYLMQLMAQRDEGLSLSLHGLLSLVVAVYTSSLGTKALMRGLNLAYDYKEKRGFLAFNGMSIVLTLTLMVMLLSALCLILLLPLTLSIVGLDTFWLPLLSGPLLLVGFTVFLAVIYHFGPNHATHRIKIWPGCLVAVTAWIWASAFFTAYAKNFGSYDQTYGALGGVVVLLFWLWITFMTILFGAEINARYRDKWRAQEDSNL